MADTLPLPSMAPLTPVPVPLTDSLIGTKLNGFVITGALSAGGMGVVYEARHPIIGRRAAVKVIRPELLNDGDLSARFLREARAVSAVKHRNVVEILDFGALPDGSQYMMMEYLEGDTLAQVIAREAPMRPADALLLCEEILAGLSAAHQVGVVHRDLKPANIILMRQSGGELIVKVLDFGLARQLDTTPEPATRESVSNQSLGKTSLLAGTPEYISPEQVSGAQVGPQGDLYALGVILYEMLSGRLPFNSPSPWEMMQQHLKAEPPPLPPGLSAPIADFVMRLMRKDPADRPLGARDAVAEITRLKQAITNPRLPDTILMRRHRRSSRWAAAAVAVGALAIGVSFASTRPDPIMFEVSQLPALPELPPAPMVEAEPAKEAAVIPVTKPQVQVQARRAPVASSTCEASETWKRATREQLDDLEKLSLAKMRDDAPPTEVAKIKSRARGISSSLRSAQGGSCQQVEAELKAWRTDLR